MIIYWMEMVSLIGIKLNDSNKQSYVNMRIISNSKIYANHLLVTNSFKELNSVEPIKVQNIEESQVILWWEV